MDWLCYIPNKLININIVQQKEEFSKNKESFFFFLNNVF